MDLSKYFDTLNHELQMNLLRKDMGIQSYLSAAPAGAAFFLCPIRVQSVFQLADVDNHKIRCIPSFCFKF